MKKTVLKSFLIFIMIGLIFSSGCTKGEKEFDITDGTWGFFLQGTNGTNFGWVYQFVGNKQSGSIYSNDIRVGAYTVSGDIVDFTTQHYDSQNNVFIFDYDGVIVDYFKMNGTFSITPPNGPIINGTWTADR